MLSPAAAPKLSPSTPKPKPKPSPPPYYFNDCSQGICSPYCLQWCAASNSDDYFLPPPSDPSSSAPSVSPLLIALICVLSAAFLLLSYYTFASKLCKRRRSGRYQNDVVDEERHLQSRIDQLVLQDRLGASVQIETPPAANSDGGLDEQFIKSITVFKYKRGDGLVESTDCAVCLTEFAEGESLRLMPNCQHAFHPPCIDTWLRSHSNCPICRALMTGAPPPAAPSTVVSRMRVQRGGDAVVVVDAGVHLSVRGEIVSDWRESDRRRQLVTATVTEEEGVGEKEKGRRRSGE